MKNKNQQKGFGLVEMVVLIGVVVLLVTVGFLGYKAYKKDSQSGSQQSQSETKFDSIAITEESCFTFDRDTQTVVYYSHGGECPTKVRIPDTISGVEVKKIGDEAFYDGCLESDMEGVVIPEGVIEIGKNAFDFCELQFVSLPSSLSLIDDYAFASNELTYVEIPDQVMSIGISAFNSNRLKTIVIPKSVYIVAKFAFFNNELTSVEVQNEAVGIGESAFRENSLKSVRISGRADLDDQAFDSDVSIERY